jgi:hypothetical protein
MKRITTFCQSTDPKQKRSMGKSSGRVHLCQLWVLLLIFNDEGVTDIWRMRRMRVINEIKNLYACTQPGVFLRGLIVK